MRINENDIKCQLGAMFEENEVFEIRILNCKIKENEQPRTVLGFFKLADIPNLLKQLEKIYFATGVYFTINPVDARKYEIKKLRGKLNFPDKNNASKNVDILKRKWLLVDCDPVREKNTSATEEQRLLASVKAEAVYKYLINHGFTKPLVGMSGNGFHLLYKIDLPNNDNSDVLIKGFLKTLSTIFSDDKVDIDKGVHNAARISKLFGTWVCKGDGKGDKPHKIATLSNEKVGRVIEGKKIGSVIERNQPKVTADDEEGIDYSIDESDAGYTVVFYDLLKVRDALKSVNGLSEDEWHNTYTRAMASWAKKNPKYYKDIKKIWDNWSKKLLDENGVSRYDPMENDKRWDSVIDSTTKVNIGTLLNRARDEHSWIKQDGYNYENPKKKGLVTYFARPGLIKSIKKKERDKIIDVSKTYKAPIGITNIESAQKLKDGEYKKIKPLIDGFLLPGTTLIASEPKTGKSCLSTQIAHCLKNGSLLMDKFKRVEEFKKKIAIINLEESIKNITLRINNQFIEPVEGLLIYDQQTDMPLLTDNDNGIELFFKDLSDNDVGLVFIDTLERLRDPDSSHGNSHRTDQDQIGRLSKLSNKYNISLVVFHHTTKRRDGTPQDLISGSKGITASFDNLIILTSYDIEKQEFLFNLDMSRTKATIDQKYNMPESLIAVHTTDYKFKFKDLYKECSQEDRYNAILEAGQHHSRKTETLSYDLIEARIKKVKGQYFFPPKVLLSDIKDLVDFGLMEPSGKSGRVFKLIEKVDGPIKTIKELLKEQAERANGLKVELQEDRRKKKGKDLGIEMFDNDNDNKKEPNYALMPLFGGETNESK